MDNELFDSKLNSYIEIKNKSDELRSSFLKHILLIASTILGVLISFHDTNSICNIGRIFFQVSLGLLSLGILLLSIGLYEQVSTHARAAANSWEELRKLVLEVGLTNHKTNLIFPRIHFLICEKIGYVSLILSVVSLTVYGIIIS